MKLNRRDALQLAAAGAALAALPAGALRAAEHADVEAAIAAFAGGAPVKEGGVEVEAPEIAENGNTVPISVAAEGAEAILILAAGNPNPDVATFHFGKLAVPAASTRIRLAGTQDVIAVAKFADGSFGRAARTVKVTIGGCGG
ncbi:thiosulfate oxidation carrier protein SoxY [Oceanicella actignis]|uniref:Sulfur-oxidizing protein SoxY n=1 Tax=Oceanicella actignis TaxID=1189325 RepID=A0A1M7S9N8_9RHOB|nr:thiosulfate oxidation carrier protein SoxY [Oceanicella actignis]TYO91594.1 sulfur-oxidizing protein SoxY [Oceanicella actignis]SET30772.1 sulfur-oxidizing protein SoxY [Oceanicella actignis]SHN55170.1 sulfur-oxidizing protein SoxY [Oceanicella actignis]